MGIQPEPPASTLVDMLRYWANHEPEKEALVFLQDGEVARSLTFRQLDEQVRRVAAYLQQKGAGGDRALILYLSGVECVVALFACAYAEVIGVLVVPPRANRPVTYLESAAEDAGATFALTTSSMHAEMQQRINELPGLKRLHWVDTDSLPAGIEPSDWRVHSPAPTNLAYVIYSSGSTGAPKGVSISHRSLIQAAPQLLDRIGLRSESVFVCWIPLYHIAGLELFLRSLLPGGRVVLMATEAFLEQPLRWLRAITRFRGTLTYSFKFGLQAVIDRTTLEERALLDLGSLETLLVTGERIQASVLDRFTETFAPHGFRREALTPGYGLTEVAGFATAPRRFSGFNVFTLEAAALEHNAAVLLELGDRQGQEFVGCGSGFPDRPVIIADPERRVLLERGKIGEIWVAANGIAEGYWHRPEDTESTFRAHLVSGEGPFLRTGDLGCFCGDDLVITGRIKDVIILRGKNYYSQDFEQAIQNCHPALGFGCAAFASMTEGDEKLIVLQEVDTDTPHFDSDGVISAIRMAVADDFGQPVDTVGLVKVGALPRTPSGKIQRYLCRSMLADGTLDAITIAHLGIGRHSQTAQRVPYLSPQSAAERVLVGIWQDALGVEEIGVNDNFFELGGDSVVAIQIIAKANYAGFRLAPAHIFEYQTIAGLASVCEPLEDSGTKGENVAEGEDRRHPNSSDGSVMARENEFGWSQSELSAIEKAIERSTGDL